MYIQEQQTSNLVYALILWKPGLGLLIGKFHQFLVKSSASLSGVSGHLNVTKCILSVFKNVVRNVVL